MEGTTKSKVEEISVRKSQAYNTCFRTLLSTTYLLTTNERIVCSKRERPLSNVCEHTVGPQFWPEQAEFVNTVRTYHGNGTYEQRYTTLCPNVSGGALIDLTSGDSYHDRRDRAITSVLSGGIKPTVNVPLFILELKDADTIVPALVDLAKSAQRVAAYCARNRKAECYRQAVEYIEKLRKAGTLTNEAYRILKMPKLSSGEYQFAEWIGNWRTTLKRVASTDLMYSFGIAPLMSDIPKIGEALNSVLYERVNSEVCQNRKVRASFTLGPDQVIGSDFPEYTGDRTVLHTMYASPIGSPVRSTADSIGAAGTGMPWARFKQEYHKYTCYAELKSPLLGRALKSFKLGTGFASTAYELLPYSFVLDWFVNVGALIKNTELRQNALDMNLEFADGVWESHEVSTRTYVPWREVVLHEPEFRVETSSSCTWTDLHEYRWMGWKPISGNMTYRREKLQGYYPRFKLNKGSFSYRKLSLGLALLSRYL